MIPLSLVIMLTLAEPGSAPAPSVDASASATVLGASDFNLLAASFFASASWYEGPRLWAGATQSLALYDRGNATQTSAMFGVGFDSGAWHGDLAGGLLLASDDDYDGGGLIWGKLGWYPSEFGVRLETAALSSPSGLVLQVDPRVVWQPTFSFGMALGPEIAVVDGTPLVSLHAELGWWPSDHLLLGVTGFVGQRRTTIDAAGLSIWGSSETFDAGLGLSASYQLSDTWTLFAQLQALDGDDALRLGGTLGVGLRY